MAEIVRVEDPVAACGLALAAEVMAIDRARGGCRLAIPGGSALAALGPARAALPPGVWSRLSLTWTDERCVPFADADSCRGAAHRTLHLAPAGFELPLYEDGESPFEAVRRVSALFTSRFGGALDLALVGLGPDGHVASLFPGHPALLRTEPVLHVADSPKPPAHRITYSRAVLASTPLIGLARGSDKQRAVDALATGNGLFDHLQLFTDGSTQ